MSKVLHDVSDLEYSASIRELFIDPKPRIYPIETTNDNQCFILNVPGNGNLCYKCCTEVDLIFILIYKLCKYMEAFEG